MVEAKARKKKRTLKKLEKAKKKTEIILDKGELTDNEKASQIKQCVKKQFSFKIVYFSLISSLKTNTNVLFSRLYKKAKQTKKKEVTYVISKKFQAAKRTKRPAGVKGPIRVVDPRMKKDLRKLKSQTKAAGANKKGKSAFKQAKGKGRKGKR